ncbi:Uncharacterised protein [Mycobacterium tuberculosis]|uniref:Uncharacterized protein n=1 Tax=Mycobacterium tuberculosis TaxID=1773 RepID=A0A916LBL3_MYCTX|nr:Uncharacterised protein [Mycobacterium tuberculosis]
MARFCAARLPYSRAHIEVKISVMSRTRSSSTSAESTTTSSRPWAASAASTYSEPNRQNRSRCSTTIRFTDGSRSSARNFRRCPFSAEPTSVTTLSTAICSVVAQAVTRATCRSRSGF